MILLSSTTVILAKHSSSVNRAFRCSFGDIENKLFEILRKPYNYQKLKNVKQYVVKTKPEKFLCSDSLVYVSVNRITVHFVWVKCIPQYVDILQHLNIRKHLLTHMLTEKYGNNGRS